MDVSLWLRELGLARYAPAFAANDIDAELLVGLGDADLRELGVASLGHRRRLLQAIAALRADASAPAAAARSPAERRQVTLMFVDLVGSTELAQALDPEDLRLVMRAYQAQCTAVIARLGGHVAKYLGDGVLAYFGWPAALEDGAERAVDAGLEVCDAVAGLAPATDRALAARVGIATGIVVVGDLVGSGAAQEAAVVGETPNLAARLQQLAAPGRVIIAQSTRRLLGAGYVLEDLGARRLHGFATPIRVWQVGGSQHAGVRFAARLAQGLTPLLGRDAELALLLEQWRLACRGQGRAVLLSGEAGIGKSRLAEALRQRLAGEPLALLHYQCSPRHGGTALHPVVEQLKEAAGGATDAGAEAAARARRLLAELTPDPRAPRQHAADLPPQLRKGRVLEALLAHVEALAASRPVLVLFEDAHWIDPTSLEFLELLLDRAAGLRLLALITMRPDAASPWREWPGVTSITLDRLPGAAAALLAERVAGKALPPEVIERVAASADGIPLFVEEMVRAVLDHGILLDRGDRYALEAPLPALAVPTTLHDSLLARLDRLAEAKQVVQIAACIGREFSLEMLALATGTERQRLATLLDGLGAGELIRQRRTAAGKVYGFRHALMQEAAYASLLRSERRQIHAKIAGTAERERAAFGAVGPEWLAHHYAEAGLEERAARLWLLAARAAMDAFANQEAAAHLRHCLADLATLRAGAAPLSPDLEAVGLEAMVALGDLASLADDLDAANDWYRRAMALPAAAAQRPGLDNLLHRPGIARSDDARIAYYEHGSGSPTLVFVSPQVYGIAVFQPIVARLCQANRVVTIESRGTGRSDPLRRPFPLSRHVEDLLAVLDALGPGPKVGVGLSRSANLLFRLVHARPTALAKLVTIGFAPGPPGQPPFFTEAFLEENRRLAASGNHEEIVSAHTAFVFSEPATQLLREHFVRLRLGLPAETIRSFFDPDPTVDVTAILGEIDLPVLVTHGGADRLIDVAAAHYTASRLPNARLHVFPGKGHLPLFTATDDFCTVLERFVAPDRLTAG